MTSTWENKIHQKTVRGWTIVCPPDERVMSLEALHNPSLLVRRLGDQVCIPILSARNSFKYCTWSSKFPLLCRVVAEIGVLSPVPLWSNCRTWYPLSINTFNIPELLGGWPEASIPGPTVNRYSPTALPRHRKKWGGLPPCKYTINGNWSICFCLAKLKHCLAKICIVPLDSSK